MPLDTAALRTRFTFQLERVFQLVFKVNTAAALSGNSGSSGIYDVLADALIALAGSCHDLAATSRELAQRQREGDL
jgi:hypothetical protein